MKFLTPFKVALCLSLAIHGGIVAGYLTFRHEPPARVETDHALEIEVVSEPAETAAIVAAPVALKPAPPEQPVPLAPEVKPVTPQPTPEAPPTEISNSSEPKSPTEPSEPADVPAVEKVVAASAPVVAMVRPTETGSPAAYLFNPRPAYPSEARRHKQEGLVVLAVQLDREGLAGAVRVAQSSGFAALDAAAAGAVVHWRFAPARMGNIAVASQIEVPIRFKLNAK